MIPGLNFIDLELHEDERGWFRENYNFLKMSQEDWFEVAQSNTALNRDIGVTRGFHAEPWQKLVTVDVGSVFGAWVDLRPESFGQVETRIITPKLAVKIPKGVANAYQTLEENVIYTYLVDGYWKEGIKYPSVNLEDKEINIDWPIKEMIISAKDKTNPTLKELQCIKL